MKIIVDRHIPYLEGLIEQYGSVEYLNGSDFVHEKVKDADVLIIRTVTRIDEQLLSDTNIKLICSATIGYDHIDTQYCDSHGIAWRNAPGCNSKAVQQYIAASLILISRKKGESLVGKTIGIVGMGNVGTAVAIACEVLGMHVLRNDPPRVDKEGILDFVSLDVIREQADFISFHTPLTKDGKYKTQHLADKIFFESLGKKPIILNSCRGGVIDTVAIKEALERRGISGAIIDCWENEPIIDAEYIEMVDIATAHVAGYSSDGKANAARMSLLSVADYFGLDKSIVDSIREEEPLHSIIDLDTFEGKNRIHEAILATYNPMVDCKLLLNSPDSFKQLRNEYNYRREFRAYTIINATQEEADLLSKLDFKIS